MVVFSSYWILSGSCDSTFMDTYIHHSDPKFIIPFGKLTVSGDPIKNTFQLKFNGLIFKKIYHTGKGQILIISSKLSRKSQDPPPPKKK